MMKLMRSLALASTALFSQGPVLGLASAGLVLGCKGDKGDKGPIGNSGPMGTNGSPGSQGFPGSEGPEGPSCTIGNDYFLRCPDGTSKNVRGAPGLTGAMGSQGIQGEKGDKGDKGDRGEQGLQGVQGLPGQQGAQGSQGLQGIQGAPGLIDPTRCAQKFVRNTVNNLNNSQVDAICDANQYLVSGGCAYSLGSGAIVSAYTSRRYIFSINSLARGAWHCEIDTTSAAAFIQLDAYADCCSYP